MAFYPSRRTKGILLWMLSTKMLPAVGVLMPIYLICQRFDLLDTKIALVVIYALINLPIIMMILFTYFREIPREILEAARMDGTSVFGEITQIVAPLARGGIASTAPTVDSPVMERGFLVYSSDIVKCPDPGRTCSKFLQSRRTVLGKGVSRQHPRLCADCRARLAYPETARTGSDIWCG